MSELKPCANCAGEATMQAPNMHRMTCIACKECGMSTGWGTVEEVTAAWNRRAQLANEPLTLEQLRKMDGEPVWVAESDNWNGGQGVVIPADGGVFDPNDPDGYWPFEYYGEWLAYRHPPERSENE